MSDLRKDPLLDYWVLMATRRAQRPEALVESPPFEAGLSCPFCEGHEDETPHEVLAFRPAASGADRPKWRVRVVPNKFPAIEIGGDSEPLDACLTEGVDDLYQRLTAQGGARGDY